MKAEGTDEEMALKAARRDGYHQIGGGILAVFVMFVRFVRFVRFALRLQKKGFVHFEILSARQQFHPNGDHVQNGRHKTC